MKLFILSSILISSVCVSSVFAEEVASTTVSSADVSSDSASTSSVDHSSSSRDFQNFRRHQRGQQSNNKRWFKYGVCVGQNLAQQGVVISAGQQLDSSYAEHIKTAKEACRESPSPSPSASPSPSPTATPVSDSSSLSSS